MCCVFHFRDLSSLSRGGLCSCGCIWDMCDTVLLQRDMKRSSLFPLFYHGWSSSCKELPWRKSLFCSLPFCLDLVGAQVARHAARWRACRVRLRPTPRKPLPMRRRLAFCAWLSWASEAALPCRRTSSLAISLRWVGLQSLRGVCQLSSIQPSHKQHRH